MDIAAGSIGLNLASVQMQVSLSMTKGAMDVAESQAAQLLEGMQTANTAPSSHKVYILL